MVTITHPERFNLYMGANSENRHCSKKALDPKIGHCKVTKVRHVHGYWTLVILEWPILDCTNAEHPKFIISYIGTTGCFYVKNNVKCNSMCFNVKCFPIFMLHLDYF